MPTSQRYFDHAANRTRRGVYGHAVSGRHDQLEAAKFRRTQAHEYVCITWFERDRANVRLETPRGRVVFDLWDDDVDQAIEDGFLKPPRIPRPSDADWQPQAVQYAVDAGLINLP
jgi:hypothetical protein